MAPEIIQSSQYEAYKADIWSAGVILFECCFGKSPFDSKDISKLMK